MTTTIWIFSCFQPTYKSNLSSVQCACGHLSSFSSKLNVMPNTIHFDSVFTFSNFFANPVSTILVSFLWCLYILVMIWARREDKKDSEKVTIFLAYISSVYVSYNYVTINVLKWSDSNCPIRLKIWAWNLNCIKCIWWLSKVNDNF